ncbi:DUF6470 family protein [Jeotgalibacillus proteolyticus]|uniref:YviE n=1 Tax=Jeotgalibacillus proteolyticus TaxID=2082395 RepID=A0A2S5GBI0_9BACL|nr:DUF6470 family protein [Jeotgalibacillus proteolyticus]PPA70243.1 hypothetical protein C4B60_11725 [Jeotgalibacillus proteolyticus]
MQITQLRMQSSPAILGINHTESSQSIRQPKAELNLQSPKAEMSIRSPKGILTIDQSQAWAATGLKPTSQQIADEARKGIQEAYAGTSRRTREGTQLMEIENGGNAVSRIARQRSDLPMKFSNIGFIPPPVSVKLKYQPIKPDIQVTPQKVQMDARVQKPLIQYQPGTVSFHMKQKESLEIHAINLEI